MLNIKLAADLKKAGLSWSPEAGDWFATKLTPTWWLKGKKRAEEDLCLLTAQPTENGCYGWSIVDTEPFCELLSPDGTRQEENWDCLENNFLWLPRVDQLARELSMRTKSFHILYKGPGCDPSDRTGYWVAYTTGDGGTGKAPASEDFYSNSLEEALARALITLLNKEKGG